MKHEKESFIESFFGALMFVLFLVAMMALGEAFGG